MKKLAKFFGTQSRMFCAIALVAVIGFSMTACRVEPGIDPNNNNNGAPGSTLRITNEQVYIYNSSQQLEPLSYTAAVNGLKLLDFNETPVAVNVPFDNPTVTLINGNLNITLGKPKDSSMIDIDKFFPNNVKVSTPGAKVFQLELALFNNNDYILLVREQIYEPDINVIVTISVGYWYCNKDVNITGTYSFPNGNDTYDLNLKTGWNSLIGTVIKDKNKGTNSFILMTVMPTADYKWVFK